jgi:hypothetical protein
MMSRMDYPKESGLVHYPMGPVKVSILANDQKYATRHRVKPPVNAGIQIHEGPRRVAFY